MPKHMPTSVSKQGVRGPSAAACGDLLCSAHTYFFYFNGFQFKIEPPATSCAGLLRAATHVTPTSIGWVKGAFSPVTGLPGSKQISINARLDAPSESTDK
jgi:hypothetical protein